MSSDYLSTNKLFIDNQPADEQAMLGNRFGDGPVDLIVVLEYPSKFQANRRGNQVAGPKSVYFIVEEFRRYYKRDPVLYFTYVVKTPSGSKSGKPPIKTVRASLPGLYKELQLVLADATDECRILAQGKLAAEHLAPGFKNLTEDHGSLFWNPGLERTVVPMMRLQMMAYDESNRSTILRDFERLFTLPKPTPPEHKVISKIHDFPLEGVTYLDIESTGLSFWDDTITLIGLSNSISSITYIIEKPTQAQIEDLYYHLETGGYPVVGHNAQFDFGFLQRQSPKTINWYNLDLRDTMFFAYVSGESPMNLKHLTTKHTDRPGPRSFGSFSDLPYLAEDVLSTKALYQHYDGEAQMQIPAVNLLHRALRHLIRVRWRGVAMDLDALQDLKPEFDIKVRSAFNRLMTYRIPSFETSKFKKDTCVFCGNKKITEYNVCLGCGNPQDEVPTWERTDMNFNSTKKVANLLQLNGVMLTEKTDTGAFSVSEPVLQALTDSHIVVDLLDYRFWVKQRSFLENYSKFVVHDGFLHPRMKLHGTDTGRLSCSDPNLQQVPRVGKVKTLFPSRWGDNGWFGLVDLDRAELCVVALLADDEKFAEALLSEDVHRKIASMCFNKPESEISKTERKASKAITFGLLYGGTDKGLAGRAGLPVHVVSRVRTEFLNLFTGVARFLETNTADAIRTGIVTSPFGRTRDIAKILLSEGEHGASRKANNTPIQGTASDIMLWILVSASDYLLEHEAESTIIFGVHDSMMLDVHPDEVERVGDAVQYAFHSLKDTPLKEFKLWDKLPMTGTLFLAKTWAGVEDTNEYFALNPESEFYDERSITVECSSHLV